MIADKTQTENVRLRELSIVIGGVRLVNNETIMRSVFEEWKSYRQRVIPPTAPDIQIVESKRAFYAGGYSLFTLLQGAVSSGEEITKEDLRLMEKIAREYKEFYERMLEGRE